METTSTGVYKAVMSFSWHHILSCVQSIQRVAERGAERLDGMDVQLTDIGQTVKDQFVALVEGHYLQRVRPPNPELVTISHSEEAGVSTIPVYRQFELPASINGVCVCV